MKRTVIESITKWIITSLVIISSGAATVSFGIEMSSRLPVTLSTDEMFYLNELPHVGEMVEDYLDLSLDELFLRGNPSITVDEDMRISAMRIVISISESSMESYLISYESEQIKIQEIRQPTVQNNPSSLAAVIESASIFDWILTPGDYDFTFNSNSILGILFSGDPTMFYYNGSDFVQVTSDVTGLFVQFYVTKEQDGSLVGTYFVPVNS